MQRYAFCVNVKGSADFICVWGSSNGVGKCALPVVLKDRVMSTFRAGGASTDS